ncbi:MAG: aminopeptidase P family protein [Proteobacteria bacterium]|jgi:Xaa-Pro aminopeptidase|nr:aminopeptidase P family protein [Pseudomonadota bacterium]
MDAKTFQERRAKLRAAVPDGAILISGNEHVPRNYAANGYPFRQSSQFLYYAGTDLPGFALLVAPGGETTLYGPAEDPDDLVWHGPHPVLADHADAAGIERTATTDELPAALAALKKGGKAIRYLPPYRGGEEILLAARLGVPREEVAKGACPELAMAVAAQRSIKSDAEVAEIERALAVSAEMYDVAMRTIRPGIREAIVAGAIQGVALSHDMPQSFPPIVSIHGEVLHNEVYRNVMRDGDLLVIDSGVEAPPGYYCSDITRTFPVSGRFTEQQRGIYETVLAGQTAAIAAASPAVSNRDLHFIAAKTMAKGLVELGIMRGDPEEAVAAGAHALFFVHGLGHMLGGDVHDMEDLGDVVGYPRGEKRSGQFGLAFLRLAKRLEPGFCFTVEPGIYFIPALIDRWAAEKRHAAFIDYAAVEKYRGFGGVRIEDDILVTAQGCRVLGKPIPKRVAEVEGAMRR